MNQPALKRPHTPRWRGVRAWLAHYRPLGLPLLEVADGVLLVLGLVAVLGLAIWAALVNGHG